MPNYHYSTEIQIEDDPWLHIEMKIKADDPQHASDCFRRALRVVTHFKIANPQLTEIK